MHAQSWTAAESCSRSDRQLRQELSSLQPHSHISLSQAHLSFHHTSSFSISYIYSWLSAFIRLWFGSQHANSTVFTSGMREVVSWGWCHLVSGFMSVLLPGEWCHVSGVTRVVSCEWSLVSGVFEVLFWQQAYQQLCVLMYCTPDMREVVWRGWCHLVSGFLVPGHAHELAHIALCGTWIHHSHKVLHIREED